MHNKIRRPTEFMRSDTHYRLSSHLMDTKQVHQIFVWECFFTLTISKGKMNGNGYFI